MKRIKRRNTFRMWTAALLAAVLIMSLGGCGKEETEGTISAVDAYWIMIDQVYQEAETLNENIQYLVINTKTMVNLAEGDRERLISELEKYGHVVLDRTFAELEKEGLIKDDRFEKGIFIEINDEPMQGNVIRMDVSKWRSSAGAAGYNGCQVEYDDDMWQIKDMGDLWRS